MFICMAAGAYTYNIVYILKYVYTNCSCIHVETVAAHLAINHKVISATATWAKVVKVL